MKIIIDLETPLPQGKDERDGVIYPGEEAALERQKEVSNI